MVERIENGVAEEDSQNLVAHHPSGHSERNRGERNRGATDICANMRRWLPFYFNETKEGVFEWISRNSKLRVAFSLVYPLTGSGPKIKAEVLCTLTHQRIHLWTRDILCHGKWPARMAATAGLLTVLAQHRPICYDCQLSMQIVTRYDGKQFWGCSNFPQCRNTLQLLAEPCVLHRGKIENVKTFVKER